MSKNASGGKIMTKKKIGSVLEIFPQDYLLKVI